MASECLLPQDLIRFVNDMGAPDTVCSLFLRFPVTSAFFRYSALEYFIQLLKVLFIDALLFKMFAPLRETKAVLRHTAELNFIVHPILFFVTPFLYSHSKFNIGIALATNALIYAVAKWYFMRRFMLFSKRYSWSIPILSLLAAWYSGAILSF